MPWRRFAGLHHPVLALAVAFLLRAPSLALAQAVDINSAIFNCDRYLSDLAAKYPQFTKRDSYRQSSRTECDVARGQTTKEYTNVPSARFEIADFYRSSMGDEPRAQSMYEASIAALAVGDRWKNLAPCYAAARSAAALATFTSVPQDDRAAYAHKAALIGDQNGGYLYAQFLENGDGVIKDLVTAYAWYNVTASYAAGSRSESSKTSMARLEGLMPLQSRMEAQALSRTIEAERKARKDCRFFID